jgi:hypothetical protein
MNLKTIIQGRPFAVVPHAFALYKRSLYPPAQNIKLKATHVCYYMSGW